MTFTILSIICLIITILYNGFIIIKYKRIPESLSETSYMLSDKRYLFTIYCLLVSFLIMPEMLELTPEQYQFLPFIFCAGLMFAGASPLFKTGMDRYVHYISAYTAFIAFIFYIILCLPITYIISYIILMIILCLWKYKCYVYFGEMIALFEILIFIIISC